MQKHVNSAFVKPWINLTKHLWLSVNLSRNLNAKRFLKLVDILGRKEK
jgi:hypothetical protein